MERKCRKVTYSVRYGADFPHSVPVKGKDMDRQESKAVSPIPGFVTDTKGKFEDGLQRDAGNSLSPVRGVRKRKEYHEIDDIAFDTKMYERKRMRQNSLPSSRTKEAVKHRKGVSFNVDMGGEEKKISGSKHTPSTGRSPFLLYDELIKPGRVLHFGSETSEISTGSSDDVVDDKRSGGNTSTLTSNEDGDSRIMSFSQVPKVVVQTSNRFGRYTVPIKDDSFTGIVGQDFTGVRHLPSSGHQTSRWKYTRSADGEVISEPRNKSVSLYSARDCELNRVFGFGVWNSQCKKSIDERRKAGAMDSGCSDEVGNESSRDSRDIEPDVRRSKPKQVCDTYGLSNSSREHQSSSVVTDLCASSDSVSLSLEGGSRLKPYHRFKAGVLCNMTSNAKSEDIATVANPNERATYLPSVQEEQHTTSRSQYTSSRSEDTNPVSISSGRELLAPSGNMSVGRDDDSSGGSGSGGSESNKPEPTFVLSSGRLSKTQEAQLGKRPTTIDDDFDQYFAQLML